MNTQQENEISSMTGLNSNSDKKASVGHTLREARELAGLSVNDVANRIKFAPRQIEWLEEDDYVRLPEAAFVRGFVRSYARLLEIDSVSLLSMLPASHLQPASTKEITSVDSPLPSASGSRRYNIIWLAAALVIAVSLAIFERLHSRTSNTPVPETKAAIQALDLPAGSAVIESSIMSEQPEVPAPVSTRVERSEQEKIAAQLPAAKQVERAVPATDVPQSQQQPVAQVPVRKLPPQSVLITPIPSSQQSVPSSTASSGSSSVPTENPKANAKNNAAVHSLRLEFDEDAWAEIKDGNDKVLTSRMHPAGSLVRVTRKGTLLVVIGNSHAVRLFDNGKLINLDQYTTADVARVKLK